MTKRELIDSIIKLRDDKETCEPEVACYNKCIALAKRLYESSEVVENIIVTKFKIGQQILYRYNSPRLYKSSIVKIMQEKDGNIKYYVEDLLWVDEIGINSIKKTQKNKQNKQNK